MVYDLYIDEQLIERFTNRDEAFRKMREFKRCWKKRIHQYKP